MWKSKVLQLIDMQKHAAQTGSAVIIGVRGEEVWHGFPHDSGSAHVCQAHKHTRTRARPSHRYVPGPVGNLCPAKELSETLSSPISLTGVEKA